MRTAIYLAVGADGTFLYCGKTARNSPDAVRQRYREHLRDPTRVKSWVRLLVIALPDDLPDTEIRRREGLAAALAGFPREGRAWRRPA